MTNFSRTWLDILEYTLCDGHDVSPRGKLTKEILHRTIQVDMRRSVLKVPVRKLNYRFMAAEAFWILTGDNRVGTIAPYNSRIVEFSDNGVDFFGAYGPKILEQLDYVINTLKSDELSRQAGLTIWRECPPSTKDVPCTISIFFSIRGSKLNSHVFMRSNDIWLGIPYDVFTFSMLSHFLCGFLNREREVNNISPGTLFLTAASSHLYQNNWYDTQKIIDSNTDVLNQNETPEIFYNSPECLLHELDIIRRSSPGDSCRWWEK